MGDRVSSEGSSGGSSELSEEQWERGSSERGAHNET